MKKLLLLILLLSVSFITSCSQDDMTTEISNNKKYAKETISFKEFLNIEKNNSEVQKLNKYLPEKLKKTNYLNDIDWEIDTTKVIKITTENIITYTFSVNEKSQIEGFRNIIVKKENNQTTNYIVHYPYGVDFEGKSSRQVFINKIESNLFSKKNECYVVVLVPVYGCSTGECVVGEWYLKEVECKTDNDGDNNGGGNPPVNNGSEWDPEDGISLPTDPIGGGGGNGSSPYSLNTIHISSYIYLSDFEKQWLTENPSITDILLQLLKLNNYSSQSQNQIRWAISYLTSNYDAGLYFSQNPQDLPILFALGTDNLSNTSAIADTLVPILIKGRNNDLNINSNWVNPPSLKEQLKQAFKLGFPYVIQFIKTLYIGMDAVIKAVPGDKSNTINFINKYTIDPLRNYASTEYMNYDVHTMLWKDILLAWLFELGTLPPVNHNGLGTLPTIGFVGNDYVISGVPSGLLRNLSNHKTLSNGQPQPGSVNSLRQRAINNIKDNNLSTFSDEWGFGSSEVFDTMKELDGLQFVLGSYQTTVYIKSLGNSNYELTFHVVNKSGWESATRGFNNGNGNSSDDSAIPDKPRGNGLNLGGTIAETYGWKETITIP